MCSFFFLKLGMHYVYTIPNSSCAGTKNISDSKGNADFGSIFMPERCCASPALKVNCHISDIGSPKLCNYKSYDNDAGRIDSTSKNVSFNKFATILDPPSWIPQNFREAPKLTKK